MEHPRISVLLPTFNSAPIVRNTLESVQWADEILVLDSFSTDDTLTICREYGARIIQHSYVNSASQKNWGFPQARHEWILQIDTDEVLEDGLRNEIEAAVAGAPHDLHAFRIPRKNFVLGKWIRYGGIYPDYQTRLFRKDHGSWQDREVHAHVVVQGRVGTLTHHIIHNGMQNISKQLRNVDRYTRYEAEELRKQGRRFAWWNLALRPPFVLASQLIWKQGFRSGYRGLLLAFLSASYEFWAHAKLWELEELDLRSSPKEWEL